MKTGTKQCPFAVFDYQCDRQTCWEDETLPACSIRREHERKLNESIGESIQELWRSQRSYADK